MSNFPEDLKYAKTHEWVKKDGGIFLVGISDFAQSELGDIVYVDFPSVGDTISEGDALGELESSKAVSEINMPFDGEILEVNQELEDSPELINKDPYAAWIVKVKANIPEDYESLLTSSKAKELIEG